MKKIITCFIILYLTFGIKQIYSSISNLSLKSSTNEIILDQEYRKEKIIPPSVVYCYTIKSSEYLYSFSSDAEDILYLMKDNDDYERKPNNTYFEYGNRICINLKDEIKTDIKLYIYSWPIYRELNSFTTINENKYFVIEAETESIAYFDSFDNNSITYISTQPLKEISKDDIKINGIFYKIEPNKRYFVKNEIFNTSVLNQYFNKLDLAEEKINVIDYNINFLYLQQNQSYTLNFEKNNINKMIKLSTKTFKAQIKVIKNGEEEAIGLNSSSPYYKLEENFKGNLTLEVEESEAFIEFLSFGDYEVLRDISKEKYKINKDTVVLKIPQNQKSFMIQINSNKEFKYSLSFCLSKEENYTYRQVNNDVISSIDNKAELSYLALFKYIDLIKDEFLSLSINFERERGQDIFISYNQYSLIDEILDEDIEKEKCENIKKYILEALDYYIYLDIAKNPPQFPDYPNYHHRKIDLKEEIGNISTENRKFYEFYQEIEGILTTTRDLHFKIVAYETSKGIPFMQYYATLPFDFEIKKYNGEQRLFITPNHEGHNYDSKTRAFILNNKDFPLKSINGIEPFDYIQNWSKFSSCKNRHSQFTYIINYVSSFRLLLFPVNYTDLSLNDFEFENNKTLRLSYFISSPSDDENDYEYNKFYLKTLKDNFKSSKRLTDKEIREKYLISKGLKPKLKENIQESINWNVNYKEDESYIKCRIDEEEQVNVLVQNSFDLDYTLAQGQIFECAKLFHSNNYRIIIIETQNPGGYPILSYLMIQLFQMRNVERTFSSFGTSKAIKNYFNTSEDYGMEFIMPESCQVINPFEDDEYKSDFYDYDGLDIGHNRTKPVIDIIDKIYIKGLNEFRKEYEEDTNLKKPTDIIIFTDAFSYSSTSSFIKGFQNIGGAIIAGYFGNPKLKGNNYFDASQSDSGVYDFSDTETYKKLHDLGYEIFGITYEEVFDDSYQKENPIPREYTICPVDERVEIYSTYNENNYKEFISEGKRILDNYTIFCNPNNEKLLLYTDECKNMSNFTHGGFRCGKNGKWDMNECVASYCDIGYSFDQYNKKCVKDCESESKVYFMHEDNYSKNYSIEKSESYVFIAVKGGNKYFFESEGDFIDEYPRISILEGYDEISINSDKSANNNFSVNITQITSNFDFISVKKEYLYYENIFLANNKKILIFQSPKEHVLYLNNIFNLESNKIKVAKYDEKMSHNDILNLNEQYYKDYSEDLFTLEKDNIYFIYFNYNSDLFGNQFHLTINPTEFEDIISLEESLENYLYLKKGSYKLKMGYIDTYMKLSRHFLKSKIIINDNIVLNSTNRYYHVENPDEILNIQVTEDNAVLEFVFNLEDEYEINNLEFDKLDFNLQEELNILKIPKKDYNKITFDIKGSKEPTYIIYHGYSIPNYSHFWSISEEDSIKSEHFNFSINKPYKDEDNVNENEYYLVMFDVLSGNMNVKIIVEENEKKDSNGLKSWHIALIALGSVLILLLVIALIIVLIRRKKQLTNEQIEEKMQNLTQI